MHCAPKPRTFNSRERSSSPACHGSRRRRASYWPPPNCTSYTKWLFELGKNFVVRDCLFVAALGAFPEEGPGPEVVSCEHSTEVAGASVRTWRPRMRVVSAPRHGLFRQAAIKAYSSQFGPSVPDLASI